ncbi:hypothetical protein AMUR21_04794 (plasmid) [Escherichia coli]|nr:hypothetical protein AMUR21_04794 [Escherichia coli]
MQASRVNGLTSGVFAFLVPASCLNQKGSDTRRDNTTFPVTDHSLHFPLFTTETPGAGKTCFFPSPGLDKLSNAKASVDFYDPSKLCFHFFHILFSYCDYQLFS